jgi:hypothetical protein
VPVVVVVVSSAMCLILAFYVCDTTNKKRVSY